MSTRNAIRSALALVAGLFLSLSADAQLFRAYLAPSPAGNDANPCTLPAPCRLLPAALAAVADGGEIWMLDSANYNSATVSVTKSVTILAVPGALGSVVATGGPAISIATAGVKVALRNLVIVPLAGGGGTDGVNMTNGARLTVENCLIANLPGNGIYVKAAAAVRVTDTIVRDNSFGIYLDGGATATISRAQVVGNSTVGIWAFPSVASTVTAFISDTVANNNNYGIVASGATGMLARVYVTRSVASGNGAYGFYVYSANALTDSVMELSSSVASGNNVGLRNIQGTFQSAGNNRSSGNAGGDVSGTVTVTPSQ
jgi:hypothetical protein